LKAKSSVIGLASALLSSTLVACPAQDPFGPIDISTAAALKRVAMQRIDDPDRVRRMQRLVSLLDALPDARYDELAGLVEAMPTSPRQEDVGLIMHAWARRDPEAAFAQALDWRARRSSWTPPIPDHLVSEVVYVWAQDASTDDVEAALADAPADLLQLLNVSIVRGLGESGQIARATRLIGREPTVFGKVLLLVLAERLVADQGVESTIAWAESISGPLRPAALRNTVGVVARVDPARAAEWTIENLGRREAAGMARTMGAEWARRVPPGQVLEWAETLPDEGVRRDAAIWVYRRWHRRDGDDALDWLRRREPLDAIYQPILAEHARSLHDRDPGSAHLWIKEIADADRRRATELALAFYWLSLDEQAARAWIKEAGLVEAVELAAERNETRAKRVQGR